MILPKDHLSREFKAVSEENDRDPIPQGIEYLIQLVSHFDNFSYFSTTIPVYSELLTEH